MLSRVRSLDIIVVIALIGMVVFIISPWSDSEEKAGQKFEELLQPYIEKRVFVYPIGIMGAKYCTLEKVSSEYILLTEGLYDLMYGNKIFIPFHTISAVEIHPENDRAVATIYIQCGKEN